jgi:outer membrane lipoprotein-sorting protein
MRYAQIFAPVLALLMALPAQAEKLSLSAISSYFNGIETAEAPFTQVNADGSTSSGKLWLKRPHRMRFEYAPPDRTLVLAAAGSVAIFDGKSNSSAEKYPLSKTPLSLILTPRVDLSEARMVVAHGEQNDLTYVTAQDQKHPEYGQITLFFSSNPIELRQWIVTDETGSQTTVKLGGMKTGGNYPMNFFSIDDLLRKSNDR